MENNQINYQQQKRKQTILMIIGVVVLVIGLVGVTYAFFNYTRTGSSNMIKVGRIVFNSNQTENIGLINVFPIDSSNASTDNTNTDEAIITINGDTTYSQGIEYKITAVDVNNTINNKNIPISIDEEIIPGINQGTPFCMEAATDGYSFLTNEANKNLILGETLWNDFDLQSGRCWTVNGDPICDGSVRAETNSWAISIGDNDGYCYSYYYDGTIYCGDN